MLPIFAAFALVVALATGSRTGWRTQAEMVEEERKAKLAPQSGPLVQGGPGGRWFYWYVHYQGNVAPYGAVWLTDQEAFMNEFHTKGQYLGADPHRYVWTGKQWLRDTRRDPELLAGRAVPGMAVAGSVGAEAQVVYPFPEITSVGAVAVKPPIRGRWDAPGFPDSVTLQGRVFRRAEWKWPKTGVVAQYREAVPVNSHHLLVLDDGSFIIDHYDEANPDAGRAYEHLVKDVLKRYVPRAA